MLLSVLRRWRGTVAGARFRGEGNRDVPTNAGHVTEVKRKKCLNGFIFACVSALAHRRACRRFATDTWTVSQSAEHAFGITFIWLQHQQLHGTHELPPRCKEDVLHVVEEVLCVEKISVWHCKRAVCLHLLVTISGQEYSSFV